MTEQISGDITISPPKYKWDEISDEEITIFEYPSGVKKENLTYDGMTVSKQMAQMGFTPDMRKNLAKIKQMKTREDDVLICAYSKAGTHWLWEIAAMLMKGKAQYESLPKESAMLEFHEPEEFDSMLSPRVLNTHLLFRQIPQEMLEKKRKIIFIQRNPKDVIVSLYGHLKTMKSLGGATWDDLVSTFGRDGALYCWYDHTLHWEKALEDNPGIYSMYYEDLKQDPIGEIKKLAVYLGVTCDDTLIREIAEKCHFDNLKKADANKKEHFLDNKEMSGGLFRKGQVGDWKNWFTVAQNERFDAEYKERMKDSKMKFTFVLP